LSPEAESEIDESILKVMEVPTVDAEPVPSPPCEDAEGPLEVGKDPAWKEEVEGVSDLVLDDFNARDLLAEWGI